MKIIIDRKALKAVSRFQAVKDVRFYLNGILIEASALQTRMIATNGHALAVHRMDAKDENEVIETVSFIVPTDAVKIMLSWKPAKYQTDMITLTVPDDYTIESEIRAEFGANITVFKAIDGKFPDYRCVIRDHDASDEVAQYNPEYLARCFDAVRDIRGKLAHWPGVSHDGNGSGMVNAGDLIMVVIPIRTKPETEAASCAWARESLPVTEADSTAESAQDAEPIAA